MDSHDFKNSADVLNAIKTTASSLPEGEGLSLGADDPAPSPELDKRIQEEADAEQFESPVPSQQYAPAAMDFEQDAREWEPQGVDAAKDYYGQQTPEQQQQKFLQGVTEDFYNLSERYGLRATQFANELQLGRVKIPEGMERVDNALEEVFLDWLTSPRIHKTLSTKELEGIIRARTEGEPLRTRTLDITHPQRIRPTPKPRAKRATVKVPQLTQDDVTEMMWDYFRKHPEKLR